MFERICRFLNGYKHRYKATINLRADVELGIALKIHKNGTDEIDDILQELRKISELWHFKKERLFFMRKYTCKLYLKTKVSAFVENEDIMREKINTILKKIKDKCNFYAGSTWVQKIYILQVKRGTNE